MRVAPFNICYMICSFWGIRGRPRSGHCFLNRCPKYPHVTQCRGAHPIIYNACELLLGTTWGALPRGQHTQAPTLPPPSEEMFIVQWSSMLLEYQRDAGYFTFQTQLSKDGTIKFLYKRVSTFLLFPSLGVVLCRVSQQSQSPAQTHRLIVTLVHLVIKFPQIIHLIKVSLWVTIQPRPARISVKDLN